MTSDKSIPRDTFILGKNLIDPLALSLSLNTLVINCIFLFHGPAESAEVYIYVAREKDKKNTT